MKKATIISLVSTVFIVFAAMAIGIGIYNTPTNRISRHLDLGQKYLEEQNYGLALVEFDKVINIDPINVDAYLGKVQVYESTGEIDMLIQVLEEAYEKTDSRRIEDSLIHAYTEQAQNLISETHYEEALNAYDRLLEIDNNNYEIQSGLGELLQEYIKALDEQQRYDEIQVLEERYADEAGIMNFPKESEQANETESMVADADAASIEVTEEDNWRNIYVKYINNKNSDGIKKGNVCLYKLVNIDNDGIPELYIEYGSMAAIPEEANRYTVSTNGTFVRKSASPNAELLATANKGMVCNLRGDVKGTDEYIWHQVSFFYNDMEFTGFICSDSMAFTENGRMLCSIYNGNVVELGKWTYGLSYIEGKNLFMNSGEDTGGHYDSIYSMLDGKISLINRGYLSKYDVNGEPIQGYYWNGERVASGEEYDNLLVGVFDKKKAKDSWIGLCTYEEIINEINNY